MKPYLHEKDCQWRGPFPSGYREVGVHDHPPSVSVWIPGKNMPSTTSWVWVSFKRPLNSPMDARSCSSWLMRWLACAQKTSSTVSACLEKRLRGHCGQRKDIAQKAITIHHTSSLVHYSPGQAVLRPPICVSSQFMFLQEP